MTSCAGTNTIAALLAGDADPAATAQLEVHLDRCPACRRLVADLGRGLSALGGAIGTPAPDRLPQPGETIGRYEIRRVVGVGGMGVVYEAHDTTLDRRVAVKLLRPDLLDGPSLLAEAQAMAKLQHPNIAVVHDADIANGQLYLCMEYVAGSTLRAWCRERARHWREIASIYAAAGEGLAYVHRAGLVHLDFKPDNVLVDREGRVRVTDFGLARIASARPARAGMVAGTPAYMAPEQKSGGATDARTDQYAFCASLREALAGVPSPHWLARVLERGLSAHPDDRFPTMDDLLAEVASGLARRRGRALPALAVAAATLSALVLSLSPETPRAIVQLVERPVVMRVTEVREVPGDVGEPIASEVSRTAAAASRPAAPGSAAARGFVAPRRAPSLHVDPVSLAAAFGAPLSSDFTDDVSRAADALGAPGPCDDGAPITCSLWPPACPDGTLLAVQGGCWTCADEQTCGPLGFPSTCNDGTPLSCTQEPPACSGRRIAAVRDGCWSCQDPFTCWSRSLPRYAPPRRPPRPDGSGSGPEGGSNGPDNGSNTGSNGGGASCGNGFCEVGESHASCAADCCETTGSGGCVATCGNGFCETGEDHVACASDCCEVGPNGACVAECGNGFCETGEAAASCPADCP